MITKSHSIKTRTFYRRNFKLISFLWYPGHVLGKSTAGALAGLREIAVLFGCLQGELWGHQVSSVSHLQGILTTHIYCPGGSQPYQPPCCNAGRDPRKTWDLGQPQGFAKLKVVKWSLPQRYFGQLEALFLQKRNLSSPFSPNSWYGLIFVKGTEKFLPSTF